MAVHQSMSSLASSLISDAQRMRDHHLSHTERAILAGTEAVASGTPVDQGRARYNYLTSIDSPLTVSVVRPIPEYTSASARENLSVGKFSERELVRRVVQRTLRVLQRRRRADGTVYQVNNVRYVADLNRGGRSPQSPRGRFVERGAAVARRTFRGGILRGARRVR